MKKYFLLTLLLSIVYSTTKVIAQETVITFMLGNYRISTLSEGGGNGNTNLLVGATPEILDKYAPDGTFQIATNAFLVQANGKVILIDTGYGKNLFKNINSLGISEEQVNVVLLTHLHGDHIGGMLKDGKAAFPNAELYVSEKEYNYWINEVKNEGAVAAFLPYAGKVHKFTATEPGSKNQNLFEGFQAIAAYGHTPGHTAFLIESDDEKVLVWGDLTHAMAIQMPHPEVALSFDSDKKLAIESRRKILEYIVKNKIRIAGMHIVFPGIGIVQPEKKGYYFIPNCECEGI